jgi:hypothetical protein
VNDQIDAIAGKRFGKELPEVRRPAGHDRNPTIAVLGAVGAVGHVRSFE